MCFNYITNYTLYNLLYKAKLYYNAPETVAGWLRQSRLKWNPLKMDILYLVGNSSSDL